MVCTEEPCASPVIVRTFPALYCPTAVQLVFGHVRYRRPSTVTTQCFPSQPSLAVTMVCGSVAVAGRARITTGKAMVGKSEESFMME